MPHKAAPRASMAVDSFRDATSLGSSLAATGRRRDVSPHCAAPNALIALVRLLARQAAREAIASEDKPRSEVNPAAVALSPEADDPR